MDNKCDTKKQPEFAALIDRFKEELNKLDENSGLIMDKTCQLRDFREPIPNMDGDKQEINNGGILAELDNCVKRLNTYNYRLNDIRVGLSDIIG